MDQSFPNNHNLNDTFIQSIALQLESSPILCLTEINPTNFESDIMWGLYGGNGKGICLEFEYKNIENINHSILNAGNTFNVEYQDNYSKLKTFEAIIYTKILSEKMLDDGFDYELSMTSFADTMKLFHYIKGTQWSHEKEYRLIDHSHFVIEMYNHRRNLSEDLSRASKYANKNDYFIPITSTPETFQLPQVLGAKKTKFNKLYLPFPKAVYLGYRYSNESQLDTSHNILDIIKKYCNNHRIKLNKINGELDYNNLKFKVKHLNQY